MDLKRFTGPQAGSQKYDLLTAMAVAGLNGSSGFQTSMLRLIALVTARYNWKLDEFSVGQRDLARMWSVDERTVKREMKRLLASQILLQIRAGVRGRVGAYRLNAAEIYRISAPYWNEVGPDFSARMETNHGPTERPEEKVVRVDFRSRGEISGEAVAAPWTRTLLRLAESDPGLHRNWFSNLSYVSYEAGLLTLKAQTPFVGSYVLAHHIRPLQDMAQIEFSGLRRIVIAI